ncbi:conserved hypothetical protein [Planktothrix serta PCC 8927]|uniref:Uncharacterized protein n=1 Tax=Planktothrix serta PCC 8927 TaxID=671068 RepID=A0A7Z9BZ47_9CYAN|nr:hormogonium polysaccharide biosynthesis protein HpsA [Planktothrix serta]VXD25477.1 conserved hypothetical protein [Planktothrix serta PCC 8927]
MSQRHNNKLDHGFRGFRGFVFFYHLILSLLRSIRMVFQRLTRETMRSLLRVWMRINRHDRYGRAGFVLPTVVMVILVVVLLSITIMLRSMDRAQNAQFVRASKAALQAATPAVDRANAKIKELLLNETDKDISEEALYKKLTSLQTTNNDKYTFGDEQVLQVKFDLDNNGTIQPNGSATVTDPDQKGLLVTPDEDFDDNEQINTAWRFPVDTDNNGKYDSFILYGIFFRKGNADYSTKRSYLDARAEPITLGKSDPKCDFAKGKGGIQKPFFVYTVTVPIKNLGTLDPAKYQTYNGTPSYSALEYQQDWTQYFLSAVEYENDLELAPAPEFNFNGGLSTQGNLIISPSADTPQPLRIYQVSAKASCYYNEDLAKLKVSGNVINGNVDKTLRKDVTIHQINGTNDVIAGTISTTNESLNEGDAGVTKGLTNDGAYRERLIALVKWQTQSAETQDPTSVNVEVNRRMAEDPNLTRLDVREEELNKYFKARLRKVPFAEVGITDDPLAGYGLPPNGVNPLVVDAGDKETLRPPDAWTLISDNVTKVKLKLNQLEATNPTNKAKGTETYLGDRVLAGNNLPSLMLNAVKKWVPAEETRGTTDTWKDDNSPRTRTTQSKQIASAGDLKRDGYWEKTAAKKPLSIFDGVGGLRVVTGAGIYDRTNSFLPPPSWNGSPTYNDPVTTATETFPIVWPDTMPMSPGVGSQVYDNTGLYNADGSPKTPFTPSSALWVPFTAAKSQGDLRMRATAVYHYANNAFNPPTDLTQTPIACVSSYYDPTNVLTAANTAAAISGEDNVPKSNNGKVYGPPTTARPGAATYDTTTKLFSGTTLLGELAKQANYVFPDGRFVNEPLRNALKKADANRTLSEQSAVDTAMCALGIMGSPLVSLGTAPTSLPDNAIKEVAFLNAREIKAVDKDDPATTVDETFTLSSPLEDDDQAANLDTKYQLPLEDRFPLEIRATQIDLNLLRTNTIAYSETPVLQYLETGNKDYMLPFSGVIYATRDDALPDRSHRESTTTNGEIDEDLARELSPTDYKLDPTRRPNGILLVNGEKLGRKTDYATSEEVRREKGLTLVSNLPVYIQGNFNLHTQGEFTDDTPNTTDWAGFYGRTGLNPNFACRKGDPSRQQDGFKCDTGDDWRQANILADAVTLLSNNFQFGYRNQGDFDLRNNAGNTVVGYAVPIPQKEKDLGIDLNGNGQLEDVATTPEAEITAKGARMLNGFNPYNNFVTNGLSSGALGAQTDADYIKNTTTPPNSSYFNNYVTPIQRRVKFSEYVMEMCRKLPVSTCGPDDWIIGTTAMPGLKVSDPDLIDTLEDTDLLSGTTVLPPKRAEDQRYPRRVAFLRDNNGKLTLTPDNKPVPLGIGTGNIVQCYTYGNDNTGVTQCKKFPSEKPLEKDNALLFRTTTNTDPAGTTTGWTYSKDNPLWYQNKAYAGTERIDHPRLVPVLQIQAPTQTTGFLPASPGNANTTRWFPLATDTTYNLVVAAGDVPSRPGDATDTTKGETNGGLQNIVRVIENWREPQRTITISGSFVQLGRSAYATAPYQSLLLNSLPNKFFDPDNTSSNTNKYATGSGSGRIPYFIAPERDWGYDVGLLSQVYPEPDLFTKNFGTLDGEPNEYFREIGRDDPWVTALLCGIPTDKGIPTTEGTANRPAGVDCSKYGG